MKVLALAPQPFFTARGTPLSAYYRTLVMAEQGASIDLLTYGCGQDVDIPGARVKRIPRLRFLEPVPVGPSWRKVVHDALMVLWTIGMLARNRYEVVHAHEEAVFWCRFLKPIFRFKLVYDMHSSLPQQLTNFEFTKSRLLIGIFRWLEDNCLRAADAVITVCSDLSTYALKMGVSAERHILIENSVHEEVRVRNENAPKLPIPVQDFTMPVSPVPFFLYAGTFEVYQGVDLLVRAFSQVVRVRPEVRLLLVGGNAEQVRAMQALATSLQLGSSCVVAEQVAKSQVSELVKCATLLVSARLLGTNTPLKIYEYLDSGRPIVATRIWSHTQVLDDSVSWLVEPDESALAQGLLAALTDDVGSSVRVQNAQDLYRARYSRAAYADKIRRVLEIVA
jgi:glycosyltransferase involved in cell wall biosynthesis